MSNNNIKTAVEELTKLINISNFVGSSIETEDKILIPVMRMGVGFAGGDGNVGNEKGEGVAAGAGVEPVSMVVIPKEGTSGEGIRVINLTKGSETNKVISDLGFVITDLIKEFFNQEHESSEKDEGKYVKPEPIDVEPKE